MFWPTEYKMMAKNSSCVADLLNSKALFWLNSLHFYIFDSEEKLCSPILL